MPVGAKSAVILMRQPRGTRPCEVSDSNSDTKMIRNSKSAILRMGYSQNTKSHPNNTKTKPINKTMYALYVAVLLISQTGNWRLTTIIPAVRDA
jgi:hypothetical protein